jgi:hypothetical protein
MTDHTEDDAPPAIPCGVCRRPLRDTDPPKTCNQCVGRVRADIHGIVNAYLELPEVIANPLGSNTPRRDTTRSTERPMPGGDALTLSADGSPASAALRRWLDADQPDARTPRTADARGLLRQSVAEPAWGADDHPGDPVSVPYELGRWEDDFRRLRHEPAALSRNYVSSSSTYLLQHTAWAATHHPDFADFVTDMRRLRTRLEQATGTAETVVHAQAPCFDCGGQLVRHYSDAYGQGPREGREPWGLAEDWTCRSCQRVYDPPAYYLAVRARLESEASTTANGDQVQTERHVIDLGPAGRVVFTVDPRWLDLPDDKATELRDLLARARWLSDQIKPDGNAA